MHLDQRKYDEDPLKPAEIIAIGLFLFAFILMLAMDIFTHYQPRKLGAFLFILSWIPLLFIHELGHALMAKLLGWNVTKINIGIGYQIIERTIFGIPMVIRAIPLEGFVQTSPNQHYSRFENAWIYFAGPGVELVIFFGVLAVNGHDWMFTVTDDYQTIALQAFAFAALAGAVINLIPIAIMTEKGTTPNDGLGILWCLLGKNSSD